MYWSHSLRRSTLSGFVALVLLANAAPAVTGESLSVDDTLDRLGEISIKAGDRAPGLREAAAVGPPLMSRGAISDTRANRVRVTVPENAMNPLVVEAKSARVTLTPARASELALA